MWCVMCDAWCVMFQTWFFVRSWLYELRGYQKHPIWVISDLFNDIPKSIPGGSHMYTISCKASYNQIVVSCKASHVVGCILFHVWETTVFCALYNGVHYCSKVSALVSRASHHRWMGSACRGFSDVHKNFVKPEIRLNSSPVNTKYFWIQN